MLLSQTFFKPNLTLHEVSFLVVILLLSPRSLARASVAFSVAVLAIPVPLALFLVFHYMWLTTGVGNPNYLYFQCLVFNAFFAMMVLDFISACAKRDKCCRYTCKTFRAQTSKNLPAENQCEEEVCSLLPGTTS